MAQLEDEKPVVAFLGPEASYTHQATVTRFPLGAHAHLAVPTISDVFAAVQDASAAYGVVPFENSSNGSVVFTLDLFADRGGEFPDILVAGEVYVSVVHCLLGGAVEEEEEEEEEERGVGNGVNHHVARLGGLASVIESPESSGTSTPTGFHPSSPSLVPKPQSRTPAGLPSLNHLTKIYSHPQAWGQCTRFLSSSPHLKAIERQDVSSTSRAAQLVAQDKEGKSAAISSKIAARMNGLTVLREGIEDRANNTTRFFVLRRKDRRDEARTPEPEAGAEGGEQEKEKEKHNSVSNGHHTPAQIPSTPPSTSNSTTTPPPQNPQAAPAPSSPYKTLLTFTISHSDPGALAASLSVFSRHGLNLTSINTRPSGVENWNYIFFVELQGRREAGGTGRVNEALRELGAVCRGWRWLGSWEGGWGET